MRLLLGAKFGRRKKMPMPNFTFFLCPNCGEAINPKALGQGMNDVGIVTCRGCGREYRNYLGIIDLRSSIQSSCWNDALTVTEESLVEHLIRIFHTATLEDLIDAYVDVHRLPRNLLDGDREYMKLAQKREVWNLRYLQFCLMRYSEHSLEGQTVLEAGCGSGGMLPHLATRFDEVVGVDVDLPALIIAAKRCVEERIADKVSLVAAMLEQNIFSSNSFDIIKCSDVIEHVADPNQACAMMIRSLKRGGVLFTLTPNKWTFWLPEPHVRLWGVQFLPSRVADLYVQWRIGIPYHTVARLMSYGEFMRTLRQSDQVEVVFVPVEDKHLNPESIRGKKFKKIFEHAPLSWLSRCARPFQPTLEALCIKKEKIKSM